MPTCSGDSSSQGWVSIRRLCERRTTLVESLELLSQHLPPRQNLNKTHATPAPKEDQEMACSRMTFTFLSLNSVEWRPLRQPPSCWQVLWCLQSSSLSSRSALMACQPRQQPPLFRRPWLSQNDQLCSSPHCGWPCCQSCEKMTLWMSGMFSWTHLILSELCELWNPDSLPFSLRRICWILASSWDSSALLAQWSIVSATWAKVSPCLQNINSTFSSCWSPSLRTSMKSSCSSLVDPTWFRSSEWQVL